jgi:hypothetical protein
MNIYTASDEELRAAIGISHPSQTTFIKQYGEIRTGTSAARALIMRNFRDVFVLMHILGDKHSPPVNLEALRRKCESTEEVAWQIVATSTYEAPSETTRHGDYIQYRVLRAISVPLHAALQEHRVGMLICAKHPYAWASSILTYRHWPPLLEPRSWAERAAADYLATACQRSSRSYKLWLDQALTTHAVVIRSEDLRERPLEVLARCATVFALTHTHVEPPSLIDLDVGPVVWDHVHPESGIARHGGLAKRPSVRLTERLYDAVEANTDWVTMSCLGYEPRHAIPTP